MDHCLPVHTVNGPKLHCLLLGRWYQFYRRPTNQASYYLILVGATSRWLSCPYLLNTKIFCVFWGDASWIYNCFTQVWQHLEPSYRVKNVSTRKNSRMGFHMGCPALVWCLCTLEIIDQILINCLVFVSVLKGNSTLEVIDPILTLFLLCASALSY